MNANFFKKIFRPPNFLSLSVAGVEISNESIKYIEFTNKKGIFSIKNFGQINLDKNIVKDGDILNKEALVKALIEVKKNISSDFVKVSIPEEKTYIFDTQIPEEAKNNIREALEFKIEENVPLKLDESSFEYEIVGSDTSSRGIILNVSVMPKRVLSEYTEVFNRVGIYPIGYEIESKMLADSVIAKDDKGDYIIVNIKEDSTLLVAVIDGYVRTTSQIQVGERAMRENLLKTGLFSDEIVSGKFFESDFSFETTYTKESYSSLVNIFSILKDEVEKFNEYIINRFPNSKISEKGKIDKIILCGKSSTLPGLVKQVNQNIKADIIFADVWLNIFDVKKSASGMKFHDSLSFATPIGLVVSSYK
jgi:type IV pilus assembly protein PilM